MFAVRDPQTVCVQVHEVGKGKIRDGIAPVSFPIEYQALCFRPLKNEVVDGVVKQVEKVSVAQIDARGFLSCALCNSSVSL